MIEEPPFWDSIEPYLEEAAMRHGRTPHAESCVYCGKKATKSYGKRPICRRCKQMLNAGIEPRE